MTSEWNTNLKETLKTLQQNIEGIKKSEYLQKVDYNFVELISYSMKFYSTSIQEIIEIKEDIQQDVRTDHVTRINALYKTAHKLYTDYGDIWHKRYQGKEYGNKDFNLVEEMYREGRSMAADMLDLSNLSFRLKDFIGRKSQNKSEDIVELKPNFCGFSINLKGLWRWLKRKKWL